MMMMMITTTTTTLKSRPSTSLIDGHGTAVRVLYIKGQSRFAWGEVTRIETTSSCMFVALDVDDATKLSVRIRHD